MSSSNAFTVPDGSRLISCMLWQLAFNQKKKYDSVLMLSCDLSSIFPSVALRHIGSKIGD